MREKVSINTINKIFEDIRNSKVPINVFYHTSKGIEKNRLYPEIPNKRVPSLSVVYIPFETIVEYYRKTDIFHQIQEIRYVSTRNWHVRNYCSIRMDVSFINTLSIS